MSRRILILGAVAVIAVAGIASDANAACNPTKDFKLAFGGGGDRFLNFPPDANTVIGGGVLKGRFWQGGARGAVNEGAPGDCPEATYMLETAPQQLTIFGQSGGDVLSTGPCVNVGCPAGTMVIVIQTLSNDGTNAYYAAGKVTEGLGEFDFGRTGVDWTVTPIARPRVSSSSRAGNTVTLNVALDGPTGAHGEADGFARNSILSGYQIVRFEGLADPGRQAASWTNVGSVVPVNENGDTPVIGLGAVCAGTTNDVFVAMRPVFDGGQFSGDYVGASTRVECDPAVADPRFKMIERSKSGRGDIRSNPR
jgi:hypothetical protein